MATDDQNIDAAATDATVAEDIFARPHDFRQSTVLAVWEKAKHVKGKPDHRYDWRNGVLIGPWKEGESRDGVWDMGHIEAWYKVVERLKKVDGITREQVIDEFNNIDNLGVEDPETNRKLGSNSRRLGVERLPYEEEENALFEDTHEAEREGMLQRFRAHIDEKSEGVKQRVEEHKQKGMMMAKQNDTAEEKKTVEAPKRVIIWDTETTGLSPKNGDKLLEIGAIEMIDGKPTGKEYHQYINPERKIPAVATKVHGIDDAMVKDMPVFKDVAQDFLDFIGDAPMVAHNANFDVRFLNAELEANGFAPVTEDRKIDTLKLSKQVLPDLEKHDLDTLADYFKVDTSDRDEHHGGLVDTIILADVYKGLEKLAIEQGVDILPHAKAASHTRFGAEEAAFDEAVEFERADQQRQLAKQGKTDVAQDAAPTERAGGFAARLKEELARQESERSSGGVGF